MDKPRRSFSDAFLETWQKSVKWERCMPVGSIIYFAAATAPDGFLVCDGASYDTDDFSELFDAIGYLWGGSGSDFNTPDLREVFPLGAGGSVSVADSGGEKEHQTTVSEMPSHDHSLDAVIIPSAPAGVTPTYGYNAIALLATNSRGGGQAHNNMPPYVALLPVIAYR